MSRILRRFVSSAVLPFLNLRVLASALLAFRFASSASMKDIFFLYAVSFLSSISFCVALSRALARSVRFDIGLYSSLSEFSFM